MIQKLDMTPFIMQTRSLSLTRCLECGKYSSGANPLWGQSHHGDKLIQGLVSTQKMHLDSP